MQLGKPQGLEGCIHDYDREPRVICDPKPDSFLGASKIRSHRDGISASSASNATDAKTPIVSAEEAPAKDASGADEVVEPVWEEFAAEEPAAPAKEDDSSAATEQQSALTPGCALGVHEISRRLTPTDTRTPASPVSRVGAA